MCYNSFMEHVHIPIPLFTPRKSDGVMIRDGFVCDTCGKRIGSGFPPVRQSEDLQSFLHDHSEVGAAA